MTNLPQAIQEELKTLKSIDSAPFVFYNHKVEFCKKLYSDNYRDIKRWDIMNISDRHPELIDYRYLSEEKHDFIQEQYTSALESL